MEKLKKLLMKAEELGWNYAFKKDEHLVDYVALHFPSTSERGTPFNLDIPFRLDDPAGSFMRDLSGQFFAFYFEVVQAKKLKEIVKSLYFCLDGEREDSKKEDNEGDAKKEYTPISMDDVILRESGCMGSEYSYSLVKGMTVDKLSQVVKQFVALEPPVSLYEYLEVHGAELIPLYSCCDAHSGEEEVAPVNFFDVEYDADTGVTLFSELIPSEQMDMLLSKIRYIEAAHAVHFPQTGTSSSKIIDGVTSCCGYDFGTDADVAKFCPICGKRLNQ